MGDLVLWRGRRDSGRNAEPVGERRDRPLGVAGEERDRESGVAERGDGRSCVGAGLVGEDEGYRWCFADPEPGGGAVERAGAADPFGATEADGPAADRAGSAEPGVLGCVRDARRTDARGGGGRGDGAGQRMGAAFGECCGAGEIAAGDRRGRSRRR